MREGRSEAAVFLANDGSVIVAGGWTDQDDWQKGPSRHVERWRIGAADFEPLPPLASGVAGAQMHDLRGAWQHMHMLVGGNNSAIQLFNNKTLQWIHASTARQGSEPGSCLAYPFQHGEDLYVWAQRKSEPYPQPGPGNCEAEQNYWSLLKAANSLGRFQSDTLVTYRAGAKFLPATEDSSALMLGGTVHGGMNAYRPTAGVVAISKDANAIGALPSIPFAGVVNATRIGAGVAVVSFANEQASTSKIVSATWSAGNTMESMRWENLQDSPSRLLALGSDAHGNGLWMEDGTNIRKFRVGSQGGNFRFQPQPEGLPPLNRPRESGGETAPITLRGLKDGRIIVAGGSVQTDLIAVMTEQINQPDLKDEYVSIGPRLPSRRHEIYDPVKREWRNSAPSRGAGGQAVILADGRVLKSGQINPPAGAKWPDGNPISIWHTIEISSADGAAWHQLDASLPATVRRAEPMRSYEDDGQIYLRVNLELTQGGVPGLLWLNPCLSG